MIFMLEQIEPVGMWKTFIENDFRVKKAYLRQEFYLSSFYEILYDKWS